MHRALPGYRQHILAIDLKELHQEGHIRLSSFYSRNRVIQYMVECDISQQGVPGSLLPGLTSGDCNISHRILHFTIQREDDTGPLNKPLDTHCLNQGRCRKL